MIFAGALTVASEGADSVWVMKGGTSLYGRLENPRSSRDLDPFCSDAQSAMAAASDLRTLMDGVRVGAYVFQVGEPHFRATEAQGVASVAVAAYAGAAKVGGFNIDVSADVWLVAESQLTLIDRGDDVLLEGYPSRIPVHLYPVENQVADKVCAMYETHETGPSTRYRDLYDLAMLADQTPMEGSLLLVPGPGIHSYTNVLIGSLSESMMEALWTVRLCGGATILGAGSTSSEQPSISLRSKVWRELPTGRSPSLPRSPSVQ